jgi:flagellar motor switch protein FliN
MKTANIGQMKVPLMVVLGETSLPVAEVATIQAGTIIELGSLAGEPVMLLAAGEMIAKGEVVIIDENFGIRVTEVNAGAGAARPAVNVGE